MEVKEFRPNIFKYKAIGWLAILLFGFIAIFFQIKGEAIYIVMFFFIFAMSGIYLFSIAYSIKINQEGVHVFSIFTSYRIKWNEIQRLEFGDWVCVFHGERNKRLIVPINWSGSEATDASEFLEKNLKKYNIEKTNGIFADYKVHKNVSTENA